MDKSQTDTFQSGNSVIFAVEPDRNRSEGLLCVYSAGLTPGRGDVRAVLNRAGSRHLAIYEDSFSRAMYKRLFGETADVKDLNSITVEMIDQAQGEEKKRLARAVLYSKFLQYAATSAVATGVGLAVFSPPGVSALVGYYSSIFANNASSKLLLTAMTAVWGGAVVRELQDGGLKDRGTTVALGAIAWTLTYGALFVAPPVLALGLPAATYVGLKDKVAEAVAKLERFESENLSKDEIAQILKELRSFKQNILSNEIIDVSFRKMAQIEAAAIEAQTSEVPCPSAKAAFEQHTQQDDGV